MLKQEFDTLVDGTIQMKFQRTSELKSALQSILHDCRHLTIDQRREIDSIERRLTNLFDEYATMIDAIYANITSTILCYQLLDEVSQKFLQFFVRFGFLTDSNNFRRTNGRWTA